ncbi:hypothetical protein AZI86_14725 [Bdellovibrio bacteriovorus]|uniref:Lipoprotein n=1 Tax=Bdellovibrio bacteriovorus TaxID=959 RepID=A0A150WK17_BDEBC|nr:hypothetical protein [Bdellovibrio bacteriovorus]KYG64056.1 hypothetical protein AZI86_14725 [Bdellovibrio bacteriovorus]
MKKMLLTGLLVVLGIAATGCTRGEVSDGSNGVGVGIGIGYPDPWHPGYPGDRYPNDPYPNDPWPSEPTEPYPAPPARGPVRPPGSNCDRLGCWDPNSPNFVNFAASSSSNLSKNTAKLEAKYGLPRSAAARIANAFNNVRAQGMESFLSIGLTEKDFKAMMKRQLPSDEAVQRAAGKLGLSEKQSRQVLTAMMRSFWAQAANVNSPYWKYCQMGGHWKTDQNRSCSKLHWPGCSPQTGAQLCY